LATLAHTLFLGDSIPHLRIDLGPGSLAAYLGCDIGCDDRTVWFHQALDRLDGHLPTFDPDNVDWRRHFSLLRRAAQIGRERGFYVALPDLDEGLDTLSSLRGNQELVMDLMLDPANAHRHLENITDLYFRYYDPIYNAVADEAGWSISTYLQTFGPGRTNKLQCDFAALMNPRLFAEFAVPYLERQAAQLDFVAYHLDGPGAIYSAPLVCAIEKIRVVQWIPGAGQAPPYDERWDNVLDVILQAGRTVQFVFTGRDIPLEARRAHLAGIVEGLNRLFTRCDPERFWLVFPFDYAEADVHDILAPAARKWGCDL
jgi:5-methyltetrahydrofolate--homocysteine methyltransferase